MVFCTKQKHLKDIVIKINGVPIERVYVTKFLGVLIDASLTWKNHIEYTCKKISKSIGIISKARQKLHKSTLINLYYWFTYPYLIYCNHVWGNTYQSHLDKIVKLQKKIIRIISGAKYRDHTAPLFKCNGVLNMKQINVYMIGIFMYQSVNSELPTMLSDIFKYNRDVNRYVTRQSDDLFVPMHRTNIRRNAIAVHGSKVWNAIQNNIKMAASLSCFKFKLKRYLLEQIN